MAGNIRGHPGRCRWRESPARADARPSGPAQRRAAVACLSPFFGVCRAGFWLTKRRIWYRVWSCGSVLPLRNFQMVRGCRLRRTATSLTERSFSPIYSRNWPLNSLMFITTYILNSLNIRVKYFFIFSYIHLFSLELRGKYNRHKDRIWT